MNRSTLTFATVVLVLAGACTNGEDAGPSPTTEAPTRTSIVDYTGVVLPGVGGETTSTIAETGTARLAGTVTGPRGPLAGATVRIDRLVAGREVRKDVVSGADGRWELKDVPGGRYRVRAFLAPVYAQLEPEIRFLPDGEEHDFDLVLEDQRGIVVRSDVAPDQPLLGGDVNLVVLVAQRTVSSDGVVRSTPLGGTFVELLGLGRWVVRDDSTGTTDTTLLPGQTTTTFDDGGSSSGAVLSNGGTARFELRCVRTGAPGLTLRVPVVLVPEPAPPPGPGSTTTTAAPVQSREDVPLELPACADDEPTTTTTAPSTSTSTP